MKSAEDVESSSENDIIPFNEEERIKKVRSFDLKGTEEVLDSLAHRARNMFNVPIALVAIVESKKVLFKGNAGMEELNEAAREISLCSLAILSDEVTVFQNAIEEKC